MFKEAMTALAILAGLVATTANAAGDKLREGRMEARFSQMDADADGQVTAAEITAHVAARFAAADANNDGALSAEELAQQAEGKRAKRAAKRFERMDADNSGGLSMEEFAKARGRGKQGNERKAD